MTEYGLQTSSRMMFFFSNAKKVLSMILWRWCKIMKVTGNENGISNW